MPAFLVDPTWTRDERERLASYLDGGTLLSGYLGYARCRLSSAIPDTAMGNAERTDGTWVWPEGLSLYVREFGVRVPRELDEHAERAGLVAPTPDRASLNLERFDLTFWETWCEGHKQRVGWLRYAATSVWRTRRLRRRS
ncbi:MAG: hypothetical protein H6721_17220 [Sandaracinus sp.]|nr:hypothetical protein [Myxococcales bacterium]MCB9612699.1 hypothetical protein [Sandaracinus sp.]MCB9633862.1 hypothetical protein [Sandaracinus sp.]